MKLKFKIKNPVLIISLILIAAVWSCNMFNEDSLVPGNSDIPLDASGSWKIVKASRNGTDITFLMDFSKFKMNLKEDGSYSIDNYLPFVVKKTSGKWEIDDPVFPFRLFFYDSDGSNKIIANLNFPVSAGKRQIILTFSTGCTTNTYSYIFEKI